MLLTAAQRRLVYDISPLNFSPSYIFLYLPLFKRRKIIAIPVTLTATLALTQILIFVTKYA